MHDSHSYGHKQNHEDFNQLLEEFKRLRTEFMATMADFWRTAKELKKKRETDMSGNNG